MTDDRVNIKVPPDVHAELKAAKDMDWPDQLLHWKRVAEREDTARDVVGDIRDAFGLYGDVDIAEAVVNEMESRR